MPIKVVDKFYEWKTVVEVPVVDKFFPGIFNVKTCLYIGIRPEGWGGTAHPNSLDLAMREIDNRLNAVDGLEVWPGYIKRLRANPPQWLNYLWEADICDIDTRLKIKPVRYELVIWWHGPEHARNKKAGLQGLANCEYLCMGNVLLGMSWGIGDNTQWAGFDGEPDNPYESHGWWLKPEELDELGYTVVALNCRMPEEGEGPGYGHLIAAKKVT